MSYGSKGQISAQRKRWKLKNRDKVRASKKAYKKKYPEKGRAGITRWYRKLRFDVLMRYSNGNMICANCGESHREFLEIDHINGGGKEHKRTRTVSLYRWLQINGYPEGFQVLCSNCNIKKVKVAARIKGETGTPDQRKWYRKNQKRRTDIFAHYLTDGEVKCSCCNESDTDVLCVDHINGDGGEHRKLIGNTLYLWLKRNNYPPGFRILCHNCNQSLGSRGYCPHNSSKQIEIPQPDPEHAKESDLGVMQNT